MNEKIKGSDLKPGDFIIIWSETEYVIDAIVPYVGPLAYLFPNGASIAKFRGYKHLGMTIDHSEFYTVVKH